MGLQTGKGEKHIRKACPIYPDPLDRHHEDQGSLDQFQRTCGVLRLIAAVAFDLYDGEDASFFIAPCWVPMDAPSVQSEPTRYLTMPGVPSQKTEGRCAGEGSAYIHGESQATQTSLTSALGVLT
jgi:hypothetical protein